MWDVRAIIHHTVGRPEPIMHHSKMVHRSNCWRYLKAPYRLRLFLISCKCWLDDSVVLDRISLRVSPLVSVSYSSLSLYGFRRNLWLRPKDSVYSFGRSWKNKITIDFFLKRFPEEQIKFFSKEKNCHELAFRRTSKASALN